MDFKRVDKKYRPLLEWLWNDKLFSKETAAKAALAEEGGFGGYIIRASCGLETAYMGDEWFRNISAAVEEARNREMQVWICDENGCPSGFGNGSVNGSGLEYQQKFLRMETGEPTNDRTIVCKDGYHFYYDINPYYADTLNSEATKRFSSEIHTAYSEKYGIKPNGFFTNEPQTGNIDNGASIPSSFVLPTEYKKAYGEELLERLVELFRPVGDYENTRIKFWSLVTRLFCRNYLKTLYDNCSEKSAELMGCAAGSSSLLAQTVSCGSAMPFYAHLHIPTIKYCGREACDTLAILQAASVAHQLGKKDVLARVYSGCGYGADFEEMQRIARAHIVRGITRLCACSEGYSLRGGRKRYGYPSAYTRQPWWGKHKPLINSTSRMCMALANGRTDFSVLLLHNQTTAWSLFDGSCENEQIKKYNDALMGEIEKLEKKHIPFDLGDELILAQYARVENGAFKVGEQCYKTLLLPPHKHLLASTIRLLNEFEAAGGLITTADEINQSEICDDARLCYTVRKYDECLLHCFFNEKNEEFTANITCGSRMINLETGDEMPFYGIYKFRPYEAILVLDDGTPPLPRPFKKQPKELDISGEWTVTDFSDNALVLDKCRVYFDGELAYENTGAADVLHSALALRREVSIRCEYGFEAAYIPTEAALVCETPEKFAITLNGEEVIFGDGESLADPSVKRADISTLIKKGENTVTVTAEFKPTEALLGNLEKALAFESAITGIAFDTESEPMYIVGKFGVKSKSGYIKLDRNAVRTAGGFYIDEPPQCVKCANLEQQGFLFFSGKLSLRREFNLSETMYALRFEKKGINAAEIKINGKTVGDILCNTDKAEIADYLVKGDNTVEITLINNLRNFFGPHHLPEGESRCVSAAQFYRKECVFNKMSATAWNEDYCFAEFGIE